MRKQFIDEVNFRVGPLTALLLGLGGSWVGKRPQLSLLVTTQESSPALPQPAHPVQPGARRRDQFSGSRVLRPRSPTLTSPGPTLLFCPGKVQGSLGALIFIVTFCGTVSDIGQ